jgi:enoyl-CoA hydratase/carnithine racemase
MTVSVTRIDRIAVIRMLRPERRNAVDAATAKALADAFRNFDADASLDVAVFTGANDVFCAGADIKALASGDRITLNASGDSPMGPPRLRLSKPVIAAIEGPAVAGGLELVLWCDMRIAGESAIFGVFNRRFGIPLVDLGTIRLPRIIGHGRAMDLILTGRPVDAAEALAMGLVNRVLPADGVETYVKDYAETIAGNAPLTVNAVKFIANETVREESKRDPARCAALVKQCFASKDFVEGRRAFMEKRKPAFTGT